MKSEKQITAETKIAVVAVNEDFANMRLGTNASLAYILALHEKGYKVGIHHLPKTEDELLENQRAFPDDPNAAIQVFFPYSDELDNLVKSYKEHNEQIAKIASEVNLKNSSELPKLLVGERGLYDLNKPIESISLTGIDFFVNRVEPMAFPYPPKGTLSVTTTLADMKKAMPRLVFNCPIYEIDGNMVGLGDKDTPQKMNELQSLGEEVATPTAEFSLTASNIAESVKAMGEKYKYLFGVDKPLKVVVKPKDSAQSVGVFAMQFTPSGLDLEALKKMRISQLKDTQTYEISNEALNSESDIAKIVEILSFIQKVINDKEILKDFNIADITEEKITAGAKAMYNRVEDGKTIEGKILVQPYLEGVKSGDIRVNILKNEQDDFEIASMTYRKSARIEQDGNFTTCYSTGGAKGVHVSELQKGELDNLNKAAAKIIGLLNDPKGKFRAQHNGVMEIGADFILAGVDNKVYLGELNYHCPALVPVGEALERGLEIKNGNAAGIYDGGLGLVKKFISGMEIMQELSAKAQHTSDETNAERPSESPRGFKVAKISPDDNSQKI